MDCKSDHICYREQQQPYGIDEGNYFFRLSNIEICCLFFQISNDRCYNKLSLNFIEVLISSGCISTKDGSRDPLVLPGPNWQLVGPIYNQTLKVDEVNSNINKACVKREIKVTSNEKMKVDPKIVDACMCDEDLCNDVSSAGIFGINLLYLSIISRFIQKYYVYIVILIFLCVLMSKYLFL